MRRGRKWVKGAIGKMESSVAWLGTVVIAIVTNVAVARLVVQGLPQNNLDLSAEGVCEISKQVALSGIS